MIRPLQDRVVIKRDSTEEVSAGGIIIPQVAQEKLSQGIVVATARGRVLEDGSIEPLIVKKGDKVLFGKYAGVEVQIDGDDVTILREEDILGVLEQCES